MAWGHFQWGGGGSKDLRGNMSHANPKRNPGEKSCACVCARNTHTLPHLPTPTHIHTYPTPTHPHPPLPTFISRWFSHPLLLLLETFLFKHQENYGQHLAQSWVISYSKTHNQYTVSPLTNWQLLPAHVYKLEVPYRYSGHTPRQGTSN